MSKNTARLDEDVRSAFREYVVLPLAFTGAVASAGFLGVALVKYAEKRLEDRAAGKVSRGEQLSPKAEYPSCISEQDAYDRIQRRLDK